MAQINLLVGDVHGNVAKIIQAANCARDELGADLAVFPELTLTGYPPEDLLFKSGFLEQIAQGLQRLEAEIQGIAILVGYPAGKLHDCLYNAASFIADGQCLATYYKQCLPNYSVFDEQRYFVGGDKPCIVAYKGINFGITICEDIWFKAPVKQVAAGGADIILNINASPFQHGKCQQREAEVRKRAIESGLPIAYINLVGGQDDLVFDGCSFALSSNGHKIAQADAWQTSLHPLFICTDDHNNFSLRGECIAQQTDIAMAYGGLVTGLRDYIEKNHFTSVVIGLSGGIDSALTLVLAVDAIGADRVKTVMLPSRYTRQMSIDDAKEIANRCGVSHDVIAIDAIFDQFMASLSEQFADRPANITEENIQARCRGVLLMAISNKTGALVLATSNKSEMAVGYSTLYGDMAGGFAPLKDVYKTLVYELAYYRNSLSSIIPQRVIARPPSAELISDQYDEDTLPPYDALDPLLEQYIADDDIIANMSASKVDTEMAASVAGRLTCSEYKRRQAPPGTRITNRAFGRDRRYPITSGYQESSDEKN